MKLSGGQQKRNEKKAKCQWPSTQREWLDRWKLSLNKLEEVVFDLKNAKFIYSTFNKIYFDNPHLDPANELLVLIEDMYLTYVFVNIRKLDDTCLDSFSLYNLIEEVLDNTDQLSKKWYISGLNPGLACKATEWYEEDWGTEHSPAKAIVKCDLRSLKNTCKKARYIVNKFIAHSDRSAPSCGFNIQELHNTVDTVFNLWQKYRRLILGSCLPYDPPAGWEQILDKPIRVSR
jgi:hypothetical protein